MYKGIIFDFYGVFLPDQSLNWLKSSVPNYRELLPQFHEICRKSNLGYSSRETFVQDIVNLTGKGYEEVEKGVTVNTPIDDFLLDIVRKLKSDYKIGLLTNATKSEIDGYTEEYSLDDYFDMILSSEEAGSEKPEPEIYNTALDKLGLAAEEAIFIDDRQANVQGALDVGLAGLVFENPHKLINDLERMGIRARTN